MIKSVCVAGGGTAGFISALILKKRFPKLKVSVVRSTKLGIIGVGEGSTEHWKQFVDFIGISLWDVVRECDATCKAGIMFQNWGVPDYLHSIQKEFDKQDAQCSIVLANLISKNARPQDFVGKPFWNSTVNRWFLSNPDEFPTMQFHFNTNKLNTFLTNLAEKFSIDVVDDEILEAVCDENGIKELKGNKQTYTADFYIDSTGFKRVLIGNLGAKWTSYSKYLKMKAAIAFPTPDTDDYNMWTIARAMDYGWLFRIPVFGRGGNGYIFDSDYIDADQAKQEVESFLGYEITVGKHLTFDPGALDKVWIKNCCAVGLSANFVEPLEATSIGTSIQQMFLLMLRLPNYDEKIINSYNKDVSSIMINIRDFIVMHYQTPRTDTKFWQDLKTLEIPDSLQEKLERWQTKLPIREDFNQNSTYALFTERHHIFIAMGLGLFDNQKIREEYEMLPIELKIYVDNLIRDVKLHDETVGTISHKNFLKAIRNVKA